MPKVRRLRDGRVFSNPRGVALSVGKPISMAVSYCCKGYIPEVEGEKYEWVYEDTTDKGKLRADKTYWKRYRKWVDPSTIASLKFRARTIRSWLSATENSDQWRAVNVLAQEFSVVSAYLANFETFVWRPTAFNLSKHLHAYREVYERLFEMQEKYINTPMFKGRAFKFVKSDMNSDIEGVLAEFADRSSFGNRKPVILLNDGTKFDSMSKAREATGVPYYLIFHCCEGDIPHCRLPFEDKELRFAYATEVE